MPSGSTLGKRLQLSILVPTLLAVVTITNTFLVLQWVKLRSANRDRLQTLALITAENCTSALAFGDAAHAQTTLALLHSETSVREASLFDEHDDFFATYRSSTAVSATPQSTRPDGIYEDGDRLLAFFPVAEGGKRYGTLYMRWDLNPIYRDMYLYAGMGALFAAVAFVLAWWVGRILQDRVSVPLLDLVSTAHAVGDEKQYGIRAPISSIPELAAVAKAFNHMLDRLNEEFGATRRAQTALRASEEQLRLITDATPALISYIDLEYRYRFANKQYEVWFGMPRDRIVGRTIHEILGESAGEVLRPRIERALKGEYLRFEVEAPYRDIGRRWIEAHYIPHHTENGIAGLCVLVIDITQRKQIEAALAKAHQDVETQNQKLEALVAERTAKLREVIEELEAFSYSIAHDMRAPLRSMQGFSQVLIEEHATSLNEEGQMFLKRIMSSANRLDRLIRDILSYSKVVQVELHLDRVEVHELVQQITESYPHLQSPAAHIRIEGKLPAVQGNEAALTQVISNLLGNAVKFVPKDRRPEIRIYSEVRTSGEAEGPINSWVRINFVDNGIGIPASAQPRLFGMFQRIHPHESYEGTGIGLAIVRKAMERMGGSVGVDSAEGRGSTFWIQLRPA